MVAYRFFLRMAIVVVVFWLHGCGARQDDGEVVADYFSALVEQDADRILELTDPYQRSPRVDYHVLEIVEAYAPWKSRGLDRQSWSFDVIGRSDSTVKYRISERSGRYKEYGGEDLFLELVRRDSLWYAASIPGPVYASRWSLLKYFRDRPAEKEFPRYVEIFGVGSDVDSSASSAIIREAQRQSEMQQRQNGGQ
jgi:hypothetical protein